MRMKNSTRDWWDKASEHYQAENRIPTDDVLYGPFSPGESELNLLGDVKNKRILEIGCGGGQSSIAFAKRGAKCTAIDQMKPSDHRTACCKGLARTTSSAK